MPTQSSEIGLKQLVRYLDGDGHKANRDSPAGFAPYQFKKGKRLWSKPVVPKITTPPITGQTTLVNGLDIDLKALGWPGQKINCYIDLSDNLRPASICGEPPTTECAYLVPEFIFISEVFDVGSIVYGPATTTLVVDGIQTLEARWHTVNQDLSAQSWMLLQTGQIIVARYIQFKLHVDTR